MQGSQHGGEATEHGGRMEKTMRTRKKKKKIPLERTMGAVLLCEGRRRNLLYTPQDLHVQQENTACSCVRTRPSVLRGLLQTAHVAGL